MSKSFIDLPFDSFIMSNVSWLDHTFFPFHFETIKRFCVNILSGSHAKSVVSQSPLFFVLCLSRLSECCRTNCQQYKYQKSHLVFEGLRTTFMYVTLRAWRANEGGTTDLPDYSETVHRDRTLFENYTTIVHCAPQWHIHFVVRSVFISLHFLTRTQFYPCRHCTSRDSRQYFRQLYA